MSDSKNSTMSNVLLVRARGWTCALPSAMVLEIMRPLPIENIGDAPRFILGMSIVRGKITPVLALNVLLGSQDRAIPNRFVLVRTGERTAVLAVDDVLGMNVIDKERLEKAPGLVSEALPHDITRIGVLDQSVLVFLEAGRLVSDEDWQTIAALDVEARK